MFFCRQIFFYVFRNFVINDKISILHVVKLHVSTTLKLVAKFAAGVVDTGGQP
jgi:hypothetical protein